MQLIAAFLIFYLLQYLFPFDIGRSSLYSIFRSTNHHKSLPLTVIVLKQSLKTLITIPTVASVLSSSIESLRTPIRQKRVPERPFFENAFTIAPEGKAETSEINSLYPFNPAKSSNRMTISAISSSRLSLMNKSNESLKRRPSALSDLQKITW